MKLKLAPSFKSANRFLFTQQLARPYLVDRSEERDAVKFRFVFGNQPVVAQAPRRDPKGYGDYKGKVITISKSQTTHRLFELYKTVWKEETMLSSNLEEIVSHPAYKTIIRFGHSVVPLILKDLEDSGGHWFSALKAITGIDVVPPDVRGDIRKSRELWLEWGRRMRQIP